MPCLNEEKVKKMKQCFMSSWHSPHFTSTSLRPQNAHEMRAKFFYVFPIKEKQN